MKIFKTKPIKTLFSTVDWVLLVLVLGIIGIGVFNLASIANILPKPLHNTQILWFALGFLFFDRLSQLFALRNAYLWGGNWAFDHRLVVRN